MNEKWSKWSQDPAQFQKFQRGKMLAGVFIILIGLVYLGKQMGLPVPTWLFTWPVLLIVIGVITGIKHSFKNKGWLILVTIGSIFLVEDMYPEMGLSNYIWPVIIIVVGIEMILGANRKKKWHQEFLESENSTSENKDNNDKIKDNFINSTSIFAGIQKKIISKDFGGGDVMNFFGGTEIDLSQADINGTVTIEITQVFGGTKLIVPSHWEVRQEITAIMCGVEDKRKNVSNLDASHPKILILRGTSIMGGIDIKSY